MNLGIMCNKTSSILYTIHIVTLRIILIHHIYLSINKFNMCSHSSRISIVKNVTLVNYSFDNRKMQCEWRNIESRRYNVFCKTRTIGEWIVAFRNSTYRILFVFLSEFYLPQLQLVLFAPSNMEKVCTAVMLCPLRKLDRSFDLVVDPSRPCPTPRPWARAGRLTWPWTGATLLNGWERNIYRNFTQLRKHEVRYEILTVWNNIIYWYYIILLEINIFRFGSWIIFWKLSYSWYLKEHVKRNFISIKYLKRKWRHILNWLINLANYYRIQLTIVYFDVNSNSCV